MIKRWSSNFTSTENGGNNQNSYWVLEIPEWHEISDVETSKLVNLIKEASCEQEARLFRMLECSAYYDEEKGYFCGDFSQQSGGH